MPQFPANIDLSSLNGTNGFTLLGVAAYDRSGFSVASAGDVNGDGFADLIVGAKYADPHGTSGASYVVFGKRTGFGAIRRFAYYVRPWTPSDSVGGVGNSATVTLAQIRVPHASQEDSHVDSHSHHDHRLQ